MADQDPDPLSAEDEAALVMHKATLRQLGYHYARLTERGERFLYFFERTPHAPSLELSNAYGAFRAAVDEAMPLLRLLLADDDPDDDADDPTDG